MNTEEVNIELHDNGAEELNVELHDINYIPGYKEAEEERRAFYEEVKQKVENGEFNGKDLTCIEILEDTNIYDLETGFYYVNEGVKLNYTEMYADKNPPIEITTKSMLKVIKKVEAEDKAYVYYTLTTLNQEVDPTHYSPLGTYHGFIQLMNLIAVRWLGYEPRFVSQEIIRNLVDGSLDYKLLENKPKINNVELVGNKTLEELGIEITGGGSGGGIPEITTDTNIFDLETGVYYVNEGVTLTYSLFPMGDGLPCFPITAKSILTVGKAPAGIEDETNCINYLLIGCPGGPGFGGKVIYGEIIGAVSGEESMWLSLNEPITFDTNTIYILGNVKTEIANSNEVDDAIPTTGAVFRFVKSAIGTALDGEY